MKSRSMFEPNHSTPSAAAARAGTHDESALARQVQASPRQLAQHRSLGAMFDGATAQREPALEAKDDAGVPAPAAPNRTGMPGAQKSGIESVFDMDMSDVQVHHNSDRPAQRNALAYAQGNDIHPAPGQDQHLPHKAWHVVQQRQGRVAPTMQMQGVAANEDAGLAQSPRLSRQRRLIAATFGPAAQRHAAGARPATGAPVQRLRIALLTLDTKTAAAPQIIEALRAINEPLTDCLGDFEARAILNRLNELEFDIPADLQSELDEVVNYWDHDEPETTDKGKEDLAATVVGLLQGVLPLALSGGGAVTLRGGRRAIKDLDFRTVLDPQVTFRTDNAAGTALIETINARLAQGHKVDPLEVSDAPTGYTIKGEVDGVEVSITRTPLVEYGAFEDVGGVPVLSKLDLLWDKAYSFIFRREFEKQVTDLYDLAHILSLDGREGRMYAQAIKYGGLDKARGPAYTNQAAKVGARGKELEARPVKELVFQLAEIFESKQKLGEVEQRFVELGSAALLKPLHNLWSMLK